MPDIEWKRQTLLGDQDNWRAKLMRVLWHGDELHVILFRRWWIRLW